MLGLTFTADSTSVDFVRVDEKGATTPSLWRVSFLGGTPKRLLDGVYSAVGWSPDGRQMAFIRADYTSSAETTSLVIADADGRNERVLVTQKAPDPLFNTVLVPARPNVAPAWSPDSRVIAATGFSGTVARALFVDVSDGSVRVAPPSTGYSGIAWVGDSSLVISQPGGGAVTSQLFRLSYPDGHTSRVTNDLSGYPASA